MRKANPIILRETKFMAFMIFTFSAVMQAVFLIIGRWDYTVLLGNVLSGTLMVFNFYLMALSVQSSLDKNEKEARKTMKLSLTWRTFMIFVIIVAGILLPWFSVITTLIPVIFPRLALVFRPLWKPKDNNEGGIDI